MASGAEHDLAQLSESQREALQQYTQFTNQEVKDAIPLLERSQWNVQVCHPTAGLLLTPLPTGPVVAHCLPTDRNNEILRR